MSQGGAALGESSRRVDEKIAAGGEEGEVALQKLGRVIRGQLFMAVKHLQTGSLSF